MQVRPQVRYISLIWMDATTKKSSPCICFFIFRKSSNLKLFIFQINFMPFVSEIDGTQQLYAIKWYIMIFIFKNTANWIMSHWIWNIIRSYYYNNPLLSAEFQWIQWWFDTYRLGLCDISMLSQCMFQNPHPHIVNIPNSDAWFRLFVSFLLLLSLWVRSH